MDARGEAAEVPLGASIVIPEPDVVRTMLLACTGVGMPPDLHVHGVVSAGALVRLLSNLDAGCVDVHAFYPSRRSLWAKVFTFIDALVEHLAARPG